jgi:hypothetical protein
MSEITADKLQSYQANTFALAPGRRLRSRSEAVEFVNQRGFVFFWPISGIALPSLWTAVAGNRPVADAHDDPGHVTWGWKDALLGSRDWYYAKVLRKRSTMISFDYVPFFYALSENFGAYEEDYLTLYEQGRLTMEAKQVYEAILDKGPLDTIELRRATHMSSTGSESRFNRAITDLQADFKILPVGVTQSGSWRYAFAYDIVARHYPDLPDQAHNITESQARQKLLHGYAQSLGAFELNPAAKLFGWKPALVERAAEALLAQEVLVYSDRVAGHPGRWFVVSDLLSGD